MKYIISQRALDDINQIWYYTYKNWSLTQADRYYKLLFDEIKFAAQNFSIIRSAENIRSGYRMSQVKSHILFYKQIDNNTIELVRVLHQSMNIENKL